MLALGLLLILAGALLLVGGFTGKGPAAIARTILQGKAP